MNILAEGHIQGIASALNMAFGQKRLDGRPSWGGAPGYGDRRPSAKQGNRQRRAIEQFAGPLPVTLCMTAENTKIPFGG
jgi:hypothetical protein